MLALAQVHPQQLPCAWQLQVWRDRQSDVWAGHIGADYQVSWGLNHLHSNRCMGAVSPASRMHIVLTMDMQLP